MSIKNLSLSIVTSILACVAWFQIISLVQWNWNLQSWNWIARLLWLLLSLAAINNNFKAYKE